MIAAARLAIPSTSQECASAEVRWRRDDPEMLLATVDVDVNPMVSQGFRIQGIPAVKAFKDGKLVDLSMTGAQLLTAAAMKPNRLITVTLPMGDSSVACKAKVMWSRLEPTGDSEYQARKGVAAGRKIRSREAGCTLGE